MIRIDANLKAVDLEPNLNKLWEASEEKLTAIESAWKPSEGAPVFTVKGQYTSKGWTEWTQGFQFGSALLQFDATGDERFLKSGQAHTLKDMAGHLTHMGVHDHGFNNVSTYGNLWRLIEEGRIQGEGYEKHFYELALKCSGAVQARRWTKTNDGRGFIHSFNGSHSLFADTIRSLRALALSHKFGHPLLEEKDAKINLLQRLIHHAEVTADYTVFYGEGRDSYDTNDLRGRTAHEIIFNTADGSYRCPNSQQGYSPFTTWTRGLAWVMLGYAEELEFLTTISDAELNNISLKNGDNGRAATGRPAKGREAIEAFMLKAAKASCDFYISQSPIDGIPYWDTGAPNLHKLGDYLGRAADPFNYFEPVDSSAAAIASQGLLRLGHYLQARGAASQNRDSKETSSSRDNAADIDLGKKYWQAGLTVVKHLFQEPYLSTAKSHQGLLLHSIYHKPNGWDYIPEGSKIARGESSMWGDYHARETALYLHRIIKKEKYYTFYGTK